MRVYIEGDCSVELGSIVIRGTLEEILEWWIKRLAWAFDSMAEAVDKLNQVLEVAKL